MLFRKLAHRLSRISLIVLLALLPTLLIGVIYAAAVPTTTANACNPCECPNDLRHNCKGGQYYAVYTRTDSKGACYIDIYRIDNQGKGKRVIYQTANDLKRLPDRPEKNLLIKAKDNVALYKLTSGEYQVNAGPDIEKKVYVTIFTGCPAQNITEDSFIANQ